MRNEKGHEEETVESIEETCAEMIEHYTDSQLTHEEEGETKLE